ncbi:MAG: cysteine--tRNA ligase, partial [Parafilimonas sp.]|nr:cysteine--tRNA ligase [Parafilimonas sp.]
IATTRELDNQDEKRNTADFALWKKAPPQHIMHWKSPWGEGFPGWHIECSAMSTKYLGSEFDIHGGGMDLQFPHHECEIAQSNVCNDKIPARYWIHNNMITINGRKMGKSYNNVITLTQLFNGDNPVLAQAYHPMVIRFFILQTHYRSTLDFSNEALQASEKGLKRLSEAYENLKKLSTVDGQLSTDKTLDDKVRKLISEFEDYMNDDFSTAKILANMFELVPIINGIKDKHVAANTLSADTFKLLQDTMKLYIEDILGLQLHVAADDNKLEGIINMLINMRKDARAKKDYATSDRIRNELQAIGIQLKDEKDGNISYVIN